MIILITTIFIVCAIITGIVIKLDLGDYNYMSSSSVFLIFSFFSAGLIAITIFLIGMLNGYENAKESISKYEQENKVIEMELGKATQNILKNNSIDLESFNVDSLIHMSVDYPELGDNLYIKVNLDKYNENAKVMDNLKKDIEDEPKLRWWLYFGN